MNIDQLSSLASRGLFGASLLLLVIAVLEWTANGAGYTIIQPLTGFAAGRLFEIAATLAVFVAVLLLRQIRERLPRSGS
jgi:hypothetical protein